MSLRLLCIFHGCVVLHGVDDPECTFGSHPANYYESEKVPELTENTCCRQRGNPVIAIDKTGLTQPLKTAPMAYPLAVTHDPIVKPNLG